MRDHTSKAFQPNYKDFCIVGLLGKNQIEIKDNHGHTTKVHHRDVKRIPMTEKVCQLYEEEQVGKVREGRKAVPYNKIPDLGWDIAETQLQEDYKQIDVQENSENYNPHPTLPLQTMITIATVITTLLEKIITNLQEIPETMRKAVQVIKDTTTKISRNKLFQNIKKSNKTAVLVVNKATSMTDHTSHMKQTHATNRNTQKSPSTQKLNDEYNRSYQSYTSRTRNDTYNSYDQLQDSFRHFMQRPCKDTETPEHKTLNNALVPTNEVLSTTWKLSKATPLHIHNAEIRQDSETILFQGAKPEDQHTRKILGTLSWVYKPSDILMVIGSSNPCWLYRLQNLCPTKIGSIEMDIPPSNAIRSMITLVKQFSLQTQ